MVCSKCHFGIYEEDEVWHNKRRSDGTQERVLMGFCLDCQAVDAQLARERRLLGSDLWSGQFPYSHWKNTLLMIGHRCSKCGVKGRMTIDHIAPISEGGRLTPRNMQPLCQSCNSSKSNKMLPFGPRWKSVFPMCDPPPPIIPRQINWNNRDAGWIHNSTRLPFRMMRPVGDGFRIEAISCVSFNDFQFKDRQIHLREY